MSAIFESRNDPSDLRIGDLTTFAKNSSQQAIGIESNSEMVYLFGAPDDEGIKMNSGRPGASGGPEAIRKAFYKTTPSWNFDPHSAFLEDLGDTPTDPIFSSLDSKHQWHLEIAEQLSRNNCRWFALGGGHDYGFSHAAGFLKANPDALVVNFDAHLDCRPTDKGHHSGTPFRRLLGNYPKTRLIEIGLQKQCNSVQQAQWAKDHGARLIWFDEISNDPLNPYSLIQLLHSEFVSNRKLPLFLSVDIDVFSNAFAPGCSQSWPWGLNPEVFFPALKFLLNQASQSALAIYEVSPPFDLDNRTSKLAAQILHSTLQTWLASR